jgi:membrane fusion protein (multidrug efflux system)
MNENETTQSKGKRKILLAIAFLLVVAIGITCYWFFFLRGILSTDDARFAGGLLDVSPQIGGMISEVFVKEGERVQKDQRLFTLDTKLLDSALLKAEVNVNIAQSNLSIAKIAYQKAVNGPLENEIEIAENANHKTEAQLRLATDDWERTKALYDEKVITKSVMDKERTDWEIAQHAHNEAKSRLKLLLDGTRAEDLEMARSNVELMEKQLASATEAAKQARINLEYAKVASPFDGLVVRRWQDPGAIVSAGRPVLTLLDPSELYIAVNIKEQYLCKISAGKKVDISVDAYPDLKLFGHVDKILRATNSQFSLIPSEGASGTYIKVSQRVPIRVKLDDLPEVPLGPGLSVIVHIHL